MLPAGSMRKITMDDNEVVKRGKEWEYDVSPCTIQAVALLERNESVVTWLKPLGGGVEVRARRLPEKACNHLEMLWQR